MTPGFHSRGSHSPGPGRYVVDAAERHRMIQEAACSLYERSALIHGHDMDDWIAAEAYVDRKLAQQQSAPPSAEVQQSAGVSRARDED